MKRIIAIILLLTVVLAMAGCNNTPKEEPKPVMADPVNDNYRTFYQVFVGSFSDSNNDGVGDLRGIINRFDYLNDGNMLSETSLGVQGIWLSPIFASPSYHKYDALNYYKLDSRFGTEDDLKELITLCKERNVKIILDLAINHTSSQHSWFQEFKQARETGDTANPYYDYYTCVTTAEKQNGITYRQLANGAGWYECNFSGDMPELNFDNPTVREETLNIAKYYLDLGVDGFRFDAVKYIYYGDTARSVEFWQWYMQELRKIKPDIYCVGECWSGDTEILEYYTAMNCFNFATSQAEGVMAAAARGLAIGKYTNYIASMQSAISGKNPDSMLMPFLSNHDMDRIAGSFITENNMRMAANLCLLSPGSPVIYYGEEIGMRGSRGGANTDANRRLAMLWGDDDSVRNPVGTTYPTDKQISTTVTSQLEDESSLLRYYCKLLTIRHKYPAIARGQYTELTGSRNFGGFLITYNGETFGLLHNNSTEEISYDLHSFRNCNFTDICDYIGVGTARLEGTTLIVGPQTSVIVK